MTILNESLAGNLANSFFSARASKKDQSAEIHSDMADKSYLKGNQDSPLLFNTIGNIFAKTVERFGPKRSRSFFKTK